MAIHNYMYSYSLRLKDSQEIFRFLALKTVKYLIRW